MKALDLTWQMTIPPVGCHSWTLTRFLHWKRIRKMRLFSSFGEFRFFPERSSVRILKNARLRSTFEDTLQNISTTFFPLFVLFTLYYRRKLCSFLPFFGHIEWLKSPLYYFYDIKIIPKNVSSHYWHIIIRTDRFFSLLAPRQDRREEMTMEHSSIAPLLICVVDDNSINAYCYYFNSDFYYTSLLNHGKQ